MQTTINVILILLKFFSLCIVFKFNMCLHRRNTLVLATIWCLRLNRNEVIFRIQGRNIFSIIHHILSLTSCWTENLFTEQGTDHASTPSALRQIKHDWDQAHLVIDDIRPEAPVSGSADVEANQFLTAAPTVVALSSSSLAT